MGVYRRWCLLRDLHDLLGLDYHIQSHNRALIDCSDYRRMIGNCLDHYVLDFDVMVTDADDD